MIYVIINSYKKFYLRIVILGLFFLLANSWVNSLSAQESKIEAEQEISNNRVFQKPKSSLQLKLLDQFQMIGNIGEWNKQKTESSTNTTHTDGAFYFQNRRMHFGAEVTYGIFTLDFLMQVDNDMGTQNIGVDTAKVSLNFMQELTLSAGKLTLPVRGDQQSSSATLGIEDFLLGSGDDVMNFGASFSGLLADNIFEYTFSVFHGYQDLKALTVSKFDVPGLALQFRFNIFREPSSGKDYFLAKKKSLTVGFSAMYQAIPFKYYAYKATSAELNNLLHFDIFVQGDFVLGDNSLPFILIYEHVGFNPFSSKQQSASSVHAGRLTIGMGFYVGSLKFMPSIRYAIDLYQRDKDVYDGHGLDNMLEVTFAYFPFGNSLNLKMGYIVEASITKLKESSGSVARTTTIHSHKIVTQVQMSF